MTANRRACLYCGGDIPDKRRINAKYCSDTCSQRGTDVNRAKSRKKPRRNIFCQACGNPIDPSERSDRKWCSDACGNKIRNRRYHNINRDSHIEKQREHGKNNPTSLMISRLKYRCKKSGIACDIGKDDIIIPDVCPVLGIPLVIRMGTNDGACWQYDTPSIDRINPVLGYVKGNVRVISCRANLLKSDATMDEMKLILIDLKTIRGSIDE